MPTNDQIRRLLALPLDVRRKLLPFHDGRWYDEQGRAQDLEEDPTAFSLHEFMLGQGWAWAPCNPLEWLRVATPEGFEWHADAKGAAIVFWGETVSETVAYEAVNPIDAALTALKASHV